MNYTRFTDASLPAGVDIGRNSFGAAVQMGVDIPLSGNMYLNFDVKKAYIATYVSEGGRRQANSRWLHSSLVWDWAGASKHS